MTGVVFDTFAYAATGGTTNRSTADRFADIVNVKEFGAVGDGVVDDRAALQAAINAAFGTAASPHGGNSTGYPLNRKLFIPNGTYNISGPLLLTQVRGAVISGAGKMATRIVNTATSGATYYGTVFLTAGFDHGLVENMTLVAAAPGGGTANRGFDLAWDGTGTTALNANTFRNVRFEGGDHGCGIGDGTFMGSEILFVGCDFVGCTIGVQGFNQNALDFTFLGGSFQNCGTGIHCNSSSTFSYVSGLDFSGSTTCDIRFDSFNGMVVEACNSTSQLFFRLLGSVPINTTACYHAPAGAVGEYAVPQAYLIMDACRVTNAVLVNAHAVDGGNALYMRGCALPGSFISGSLKVPTIKENI